MPQTIPAPETSGQAPAPVIAVRRLRFAYSTGGFELSIPELRVDSGDRLAITGPSGSGKTTLIHLLSGLLLPDEGHVRLHGFDLSDLAGPDRQDLRILKVGLVFQELELLEYLNVVDNVLLPYRISPVLELDAEVRARALGLLAEVRLEDKLDRRPAQLSQGERQRVALARALVTRPGVVFGDEPTGNLDPGTRDRVVDVLFRYAEETGAPLVLVSHDRELVARFPHVLDLPGLAAGRPA